MYTRIKMEWIYENKSTNEIYTIGRNKSTNTSERNETQKIAGQDQAI